MTGSISEGDDLSQGACERALQRFAQIQVEARLDSWMYTMRWMWIDETRSRRVRQQHIEHNSLAANQNRSHYLPSAATARNVETMFAWRYLDPKVTAQVMLLLAQRFEASSAVMRHETKSRSRLCSQNDSDPTGEPSWRVE
jgi:DNA-directed RNA polymerase specialized sigma24 family protein